MIQGIPNNSPLNASVFKTVGDYTYYFNDKIGQGMFGEVYKGFNQKTLEKVAVKVIPDKFRKNPQMLQLLHQEAEVLNSLNSPFIVKLHNIYETQNNIYIITEFCNGGNLLQYLMKRIILSEQEVCQILIDLLEGFKELRKLNIVHRDLKPENILIHDGRVKISDFGFSRRLLDNDVLNNFIGTPIYMAPQALTPGEKYTSKCDIWSLGITIYQLLFGKPAWDGRDAQEVITLIKIHSPLQIPKQPPISESMKDFLQGCLQIYEQNRFSWSEICNLQKKDITKKSKSYSLEKNARISQKENTNPVINFQHKNKNADINRQLFKLKMPLGPSLITKPALAPKQIYKLNDPENQQKQPLIKENKKII